MRSARHGKGGFTLIEIMIVVAIVALLTAITIPFLTRVRMNAFEGAAKQNLRVIATSAEAYRTNQTPPTYPPNLQALGGANPPYIDSRLAGGSCQGYNYNYSLVSAAQFTCTATPVTPNITGINIYFVDESGVIRYTDASGQPIE